MKKLLLVILSLFYFSAMSQEVIPKYGVPKFPDCSCGGYNVEVGQTEGLPRSIKSGELIIIKEGAPINLTASLICKSQPGSTEDNCETCKSMAWKILDENGGVIKDWTYTPIPKEIKTDRMECDKTYTIVIQGKCGCTLCAPFTFRVKKECCNCSIFEGQNLLNGPSSFCLEKPCNENLTFTVPENPDNNCKTVYNWTVTNPQGGAIVFTGQSTNAISINCNVLKAGDYNIKIEIRCGGKVYTFNKALNICLPPSGNFSQSSDGNSVTFTSNNPTPAGCYEVYYFFQDTNNSCTHDPSIDGGVTGQIGSTATFNGLLNNTQYVVHHYVICDCGGIPCYKLEAFCFRWMINVNRTSNGGGNTTPLQKISETQLNGLDDIPAAIRLKLPKELLKNELKTRKQ